MRAVELDATDAAIVRELQTDGRLAFETLAGRVGLSRAATRLRVQRLLGSGALQVIGIVHPAVRSIRAVAHLFIDVFSDAAPVAGAVAALPHIAPVSLTAGRFPLVAEVRGRGLPDLTEAVERVRALPGVRDVDTAVCTHVLKDPHLPAQDPRAVDVDPLDERLMRLLEKDGRTSFADLAGAVGLSAGAVRSRVLRLINASAIRVTAVVDPAALGFGRIGGFALRLEEESGDALNEVTSWERIHHLTRCLGRVDAIGTVAAESTSDLYSVYERLRALPGIRVVETWVHVETVKERYAPVPPEAGRLAVAGR
ncbi:Lrp/AsnC family transcriptional regulator [Marinactinospora thermotolerans]|uniref:Lrp/AsnC family transcriptional regulator n=1 Tax=Marinactinospora thermotolerans TaxID=531310 RepID=UPI003D8F1D63